MRIFTLLASFIIGAAPLAWAQPTSQTAIATAFASGRADAAKLPDVLGIHLGMPAAQAVALVRSNYAGADNRLVAYYAKFQDTNDPAWMTNIQADKPGPGGLGDEIRVWFNSPPNPQVVVRITRVVNMTQPTTMANLVSSVRQKYGQEAPVNVVKRPMSWVLDEQGRPAAPNGYLTTNFNSYGSGTPGTQNPPAPVTALTVGEPITPLRMTQLLSMTPYPVVVWVGGIDSAPEHANQLAQGFTLEMIESAEDLRDYVATSKYVHAAAAVAQQKQIQKAGQQAAPKF